jgi:hypothetical protein
MVFRSSRFRTGCTFTMLLALLGVGVWIAVAVYHDPAARPAGIFSPLRLLGRYGGIAVGGLLFLIFLPALVRFLMRGGFAEHYLAADPDGLSWRGPEATGSCAWDAVTAIRIEGVLAPNTLVICWREPGEEVERQARLPAYQFGQPLKLVHAAVERLWRDREARAQLPSATLTP